jgi:Putative zinc-finger
MQAEAVVTPLTVACARVRQWLPAYYDDALEPLERQQVKDHLLGCEECSEQLDGLRRALGALTTLTADDLGRLRASLGPEMLGSGADSDRDPGWAGDLDSRPLGRLVVLLAAAMVLVAAGLASLGVWSRSSGDPQPGERSASLAPDTPDGTSTPAATVLPTLPVIGSMVGAEEDAGWFAEHGGTFGGGLGVEPDGLELTPLTAPAEPEPPLVVAEAVLPEPPDAVVPDPRPEPVPVAVAAGQPMDDDPVGDPQPQGDLAPDDVRALVGRLQLSTGLAYKDVVVYFLRDPEARDRLSRDRSDDVLTVRETSPPDPLRVSARDGTGLILAGELLDGPLGLRIAPSDVVVRSRTTLDGVLPVSWTGVEGRRGDPILRGPVRIPSRGLLALQEGGLPGPVTQLLESLDDPSLLEFRRLRSLLSDVEPESRELERRLIAHIRSVRGLRGVAISVRGTPRSLDLFPSSRSFSRSLGTILRGALLEAQLEDETPDDRALGADPRRTDITDSSEDLRPVFRVLLALFDECREDDRIEGRFLATGGAGFSALTIEGRRLVHGSALPR